MRKLLYLIPLLALMACEGDEGPAGPQGPAGAANVRVWTGILTASDWTLNSSAGNTNHWAKSFEYLDGFSSDYLEDGLVVAYFQGTPDEWIPLPIDKL